MITFFGSTPSVIRRAQSVVFVGAVFVGAVFVGAVFVGAVFVGVVFVGAVFVGVVISVGAPGGSAVRSIG
ncbi:pentapeptide repeat-containing protein [Kitasatospora sp. RG8]|uniref:pentapeptide repeat-containing protein n=1 Tax=Kitasatospora sp. RG8 TaxID=2820815 RepID=UPI001ADF2E92|nr:pentapeptide repeat-containing protein [Kitasatospora sp. RG8]MBP0449874.1 pentapeptide repeat-containing protein [Kitasatospora sp. RG8]